ncbi:Scaffold attachment factor B2 [Clarias magur]|uniref:Scaffold attachment factor B2 n=1 Tax=Clarias magur TaxID=1594786 RepID=A0A8J4UWS5_CLAMG|nr:Scaffold attachment factor B2 [Clarias magur]
MEAFGGVVFSDLQGKCVQSPHPHPHRTLCLQSDSRASTSKAVMCGLKLLFPVTGLRENTRVNRLGYKRPKLER